MVNKTSQKSKNSYHLVFTHFGEEKGPFESKLGAWIVEATLDHLVNHPDKVNLELFPYIFMVSFFDLMHFLGALGPFSKREMRVLGTTLFLFENYGAEQENTFS